MESSPTQAVLPLLGLAAHKVIRDRYIRGKTTLFIRSPAIPSLWGNGTRLRVPLVFAPPRSPRLRFMGYGPRARRGCVLPGGVHSIGGRRSERFVR
ncbi:MAG: hypothetical protein ACQESR_29625 [Planctomycetota bacterium]